MATASGSGSWIAKGVHVISWTLTTGVTVGRAFCAPFLPDKTVEVAGTVGGAVAIQGSNAPFASSASYVALNDTRGEGNAASFTAPNRIALLENPKWIRPKMTTVTGGSTNCTIRIVSQSTKR